MTDNDGTVKVESYERRKPSTQKPRTDNSSLESEPQSPGATRDGVRIMSKSGEKQRGVRTHAVPDGPGDPQTKVTVGTPGTPRSSGDDERHS